MSRRTSIIDRLGDLAGPLGPFTSIEARDAEQAEWHRQLTKADAAVLADLLYTPPTRAERGPGSDEHFTLEVVEALAAVGRTDPRWFSTLAEQHFAERGPHAGLIEALGEVGGEAAATVLIDSSARYTLTVDEMMALVCSLGEIGGERARAHLVGLREQLGPEAEPDLLREIDIALAPKPRPGTVT